MSWVKVYSRTLDKRGYIEIQYSSGRKCFEKNDWTLPEHRAFLADFGAPYTNTHGPCVICKQITDLEIRSDTIYQIMINRICMRCYIASRQIDITHQCWVRNQWTTHVKFDGVVRYNIGYIAGYVMRHGSIRISSRNISNIISRSICICGVMSLGGLCAECNKLGRELQLMIIRVIAVIHVICMRDISINIVEKYLRLIGAII